MTDHFVRKLAHFTEFALLGFQLLFLLAKTKKSFLRATEYGFFAAFLDESIQLLSGRGDQIVDVWLDTGGAAFGAAIALAVAALVRWKSKLPDD